MHDWNIMTSNNFDHSWYSGNGINGNIGGIGNMHIKSEQTDIISYSTQQQLHHHLLNQQLLATTTAVSTTPTSIMATTVATPPQTSSTTTTTAFIEKINDSNPTSPQSMESNDFNQLTNGLYYDNNPNRSLGFNPLTPPGYPGAILTHQLQQNKNQQLLLSHQMTPNRLYTKNNNSNNIENNIIYPVTSTLTPSHTPPMDVTPPKSPKNLIETPEKVELLNHHDHLDQIEHNNIDNFIDSDNDTRSMEESDLDDDNLKIPKVNSHGKMKMYKCKQCDFVAVTKMTFWEHTKNHIKPEKMLKCLKCPFVTEYKHHLEYHLRNHEGTKPFQCSHCNYSCVNKSMLNSHLKSHSNVYQYRCTDCNYATKYCHSLKLHLRKYSHKPAMVLNSDGTPNPLPIIDVYGTRRGPKTRNSSKHNNNHNNASLSNERLRTKSPSQKKQQKQSSSSSSSQSHHLPNIMQSMLPNSLANILHPASNHPMFPYLNLNFHMFAVRQQQQQQQQAALSQLSPNQHDTSFSLHSSHDDDENDIEDDNNDINEHNHDLNDNIMDQDQPNNDNIKKTNNNIGKVNNSALDLTQTSNKTMELWEINRIRKLTTTTDDDDYDDDEEEEELPTQLTSSTPSTPSTYSSLKNRRKGRAFKLDIMKDYSESEEDATLQNINNKQLLNEINNRDIERVTLQKTLASTTTTSTSTPPLAATTTIIKTVTTPLQTEGKLLINNNNNNNNDIKQRDAPVFDCKFCYITFKDAVLHSIHMGYHGYNDVFKCNMCGEKCDDRISFFLHIARNPHS